MIISKFLGTIFERIKDIDISNYTQDQYRKYVDTIIIEEIGLYEIRQEEKIDKDIPIPKTYDRHFPYYRRDCIATLKSLDVGDSILIKDRVRETVRTYVVCAERRTNLKFTVKSISHKEHRIWRIGNDVDNKLCKTKKCSRCKMDMNKDKKSGGCRCFKEKHTSVLYPITSGKTSRYNVEKTLDYIDEFYDGYGSYDAVRRNIDNEEFGDEE